MVKIENWEISHVNIDPYKPPEAYQRQLVGEVYGHPLYTDGKRIRTSNIKRKTANTVLTLTGTLYNLGKPHKDYVKWCKEKGFKI